MKKSFNIQELLHSKFKNVMESNPCTPPPVESFSKDTKNTIWGIPVPVDLMTAKQNKTNYLPSLIDRLASSKTSSFIAIHCTACKVQMHRYVCVYIYIYISSHTWARKSVLAPGWNQFDETQHHVGFIFRLSDPMSSNFVSALGLAPRLTMPLKLYGAATLVVVLTTWTT